MIRSCSRRKRRTCVGGLIRNTWIHDGVHQLTLLAGLRRFGSLGSTYGDGSWQSGLSTTLKLGLPFNTLKFHLETRSYHGNGCFVVSWCCWLFGRWSFRLFGSRGNAPLSNQQKNDNHQKKYQNHSNSYNIVDWKNFGRRLISSGKVGLVSCIRIRMTATMHVVIGASGGTASKDWTVLPAVKKATGSTHALRIHRAQFTWWQ